VGGNDEIVEDGQWGRTFESGNTSQLARLMEQYVNDPAMRGIHAVAARRAATERFSLDMMVAQYQSIYESLLQRDRLCRA